MSTCPSLCNCCCMSVVWVVHLLFTNYFPLTRLTVYQSEWRCVRPRFHLTLSRRAFFSVDRIDQRSSFCLTRMMKSLSEKHIFSLGPRGVLNPHFDHRRACGISAWLLNSSLCHQSLTLSMHTHTHTHSRFGHSQGTVCTGDYPHTQRKRGRETGRCRHISTVTGHLAQDCHRASSGC